MSISMDIRCDGCNRYAGDGDECYCRNCYRKSVEEARREGYDDGYRKGQSDYAASRSEA